MAIALKNIITGALMIIELFGCNDSKRCRAIRKVTFSCQEIYVDTTKLDLNILFKIKAVNNSRYNFYFFSNPSDIYKDSIYSNFFLLDTVKEVRYQLLCGPSENPLFSMKTYNLPVLLIHSVSWKALAKSNSKNGGLSRSKRYLILNFLKRSKLIQVNDKRDFLNHNISYKYFIKDTVNIRMPDTVRVNLTIPNIDFFMDDSLFQEHYPGHVFLTK
jgi:hypothetical protein